MKQSLSDKVCGTEDDGYYLEEDVKEAIKELKDKMRERIEFLSEFEGLKEAFLQRAELRDIEKSIDIIFGEKLTK